MIIRALSAVDSLTDLTRLLNRSYAPLAEQGFRFVASYQDVIITKKRLERGTCFVAVEADVIIGTISVYGHEPGGLCEYYQTANVWHFGQFAVDIDFQKRGIGKSLLAHAEEFAVKHGATELALDTAEGADHLISWYESHGFKPVGTVQWPVTNYRSRILSKYLNRKGDADE